MIAIKKTCTHNTSIGLLFRDSKKKYRIKGVQRCIQMGVLLVPSCDGKSSGSLLGLELLL